MCYNEYGDNMYNIKSNNSAGGVAVGVIFAIIGLIMTIVFYFIFCGVKYFYNTKAKVIDYSWYYNENRDDDATLYKVDVTFKYKDEIYTCTPNYSTNQKHKVKYIYFKDTNPKSCMVDLKEEVGNYIYLIMLFPFMFFFIGLLLFIKFYSTNKKYKLLKQNGILAKNIPCTVVNLNTNVNGRRYVQIKAQYTFPDGTTKELKRTLLATKNDLNRNTCDLLFLLEDYKIYYLDFNIEYETYTF